ncbi:TonB-linked outer membrane protein, SusC/RagA family [Bacteroidetes bacterium oral taxon 272 str. F0290]|nr:TonB-linked outer membrane protein, SusC/RagA family [Bacteroidetes bacterium oral taxon 272 str. F0290]
MNVLSGYKTWKHFLRGMKMTALLLFLCVGSASPSGRYSDGVLTPRAEESCDANGRESVDQHHRIRGKVVDSSGDPVIGANVLEKGTANGTVTDVEGNFVLTVSDHPTLVVSYIGYTTVEIRLGDRQIVNIVLKEDAEALDEVVVVGYGFMQKRDLTGAVSQIKGDQLSNLPLRSASDALQGKIAGVTVTANSGSPGALGDVRIRGIGTLNGNDPLYVVDGLPQGGIGWLNAHDIQNIEVLKDASAQAIYGSRAANGVILITTKRGEKGDTYVTNIEFDASVGFQSANKEYDMLDAEGFMEYKNRAYTAAGKELISDFSTPEKRETILNFLSKNSGRQGTNWWKAITNSPSEALNQNYHIAFSGGMNKWRYRSSFGYMDHQGLVKGSAYKRLNGRLNVDAEVKKWLALSANVNVSYEERKNIDENNSYQATVFTAAAADPITPVYRDKLVDVPEFLKDRIYDSYEPTNPWSKYTGVLYSNKNNPVAQVHRAGLNKWHGTATKVGLSGDFKIAPSLTFKSSISIDLIRDQSDGFTPKYYLDGDEYSSYATASRFLSNTDYWVFDNYLTYIQKWGEHHVTAMAGTSAEKNRYEYIGASKQGMINNEKGQQIIDAGTLNPAARGYYTVNTLNSYFGRIFYSYANRYLLTANVRYDGSSQFAAGHRWGIFPSISGGWNFSEEPFMNGIKKWLSQGKVRVGWGEIGNQTIPGGAYLNLFSNSDYVLFGINNPQLSGRRSQVGNEDLKWETTRQFDIGLDLSFLNGSLRVSFDYYNRKTDDMLVQVPVPAGLGFPNIPWVNAGSIDNRGFEITVEYDGKINDFGYMIHANVSTYKNKVTNLGSDANIPGTDVHLGYYTYTMTEVGKPIGYYYGYKTDGVFQTQEEVANYVNNGQQIMPHAKAGDLKFVDRNKDGKLDNNDRTMIGNPHPDFTFGLTLGGQYKGFDLIAFFQGSVGNDLLNILKYDLYGGVGWYNAPKDILTTFWNGPGSTNKNFAIDADSRLNREMSDWFIEDGSYVRLKNLQLGYTLPASSTRKINVNKLRVYVAAQNLFTITGYSGLDPEIGEFNKNPRYKGVDMGYYPQPRTILFGVNMKF